MTTNRQGSPFYVPPEAYSGEVSAATDVWALGVTMVQALTGKLPFPGPSEAEVMNQVLSQAPKVPPLPDPFVALVQGCLIKDRSSRWTIPQVLAALNPPPATPDPRMVRPPQVSPQHRRETVAIPSPWNIDAVPLKSEKRVDYTRLRDLLKAGQWKKADQETYQRMLEVTGRTQEGWFRREDLLNLPCADLKTIDQLWVRASQGRYGFSVQKEIYVKCGAKLDGNYPGNTIWYKFCEEVGWRVNNSDNKYTICNTGDLDWGGTGVPGHLPWCEIKRKWTRLLFSRIETCEV